MDSSSFLIGVRPIGKLPPIDAQYGPGYPLQGVPISFPVDTRGWAFSPDASRSRTVFVKSGRGYGCVTWLGKDVRRLGILSFP